MSGYIAHEERKLRNWLWAYTGEWLALIDTVVALLTLNFYCPSLESKFYNLRGH